MRARGSIGPDGIGVTTAEIFDRQGFVGTSAQTLLDAAQAMSDELRWQFDLAWALGELHLSALVDENFLWQPAPLSWTVRPDASGVWQSDWADTEPDPLPVPTIGWLTWHINCRRWSATFDRLSGRTPRERADVTWAGSGAAAVADLRALAAQWRELLTGLADNDLAQPSSFPWVPVAATPWHTPRCG